MSRMNGLNMRNSKMKILLYCAVVFGLLLTIYLLSSTHSRLKDVKGAYEICQQQKDSLLAQLQVVYEQKSRVEKFLQQEKLDHKKTREDDLQKSESNSQLEKDKTDLESKLSRVQQEKLSIQAVTTQLKEKLSQNEEELNKLQTEKENSVQIKETEINNLKSQVSNMVLERDQLQHRFDTQQTEFQHLAEQFHTLESEKNHLEDQFKQKMHNSKMESNNIGGESENALNEIKNGKHSNNIQALNKPKQDTANANNIVLVNGGGGGGGGGGGADTNQALKEQNKAKLSEESLKLVTQKVESHSFDLGKENNDLPQVQPPMDKKTEQDDAQDKKEAVALYKRESMFLQKNQKSVLNEANPNLIENNRARGGGGEEEKSPLAPPNESQMGIGQRVPNIMQPWENGIKRGPQLKQQANQNVQGGQNNHQAEEDENYHDDAGDDDAAEEQEGGDDANFMGGGDKNVRDRQFQDNDFEDNPDGGDQNHAKEEGVVVAPK